MTTHYFTKKSISNKNKIASTGQKITYLGGSNTDQSFKINNLENRINNQEKKLDKILELLQNGNNIPNADK